MVDVKDLGHQEVEKPDGQYDAVMGGKDCVETITTKEADDGVLETNLDYTPKQAHRWKFTTCHNRGNYDAIDWSK